MAFQFNPPPGWPAPPPGFVPPPGWRGDPSWPPPPAGWVYWIPEGAPLARPPLTPTTKRFGIALIVAAAVLAIVSVIFIVRNIAPAVSQSLLGSTTVTPVVEVKHLSAGRYVVFERTGSSTGAGDISVSTNGFVTITPDQVVVIDPHGTKVKTSEYTSNTRITRNGRIFTGAVLFHAPVSGLYEITVRSDGPDEVIITKDLGSAVVSAARRPVRHRHWCRGIGEDRQRQR